MKILNAIHAQGVGGVDQMFRNYAKALINLGHDVSLLISNNSNNNYKINNVKKIFKLKNFSQISDFLHLLLILVIYRPNLVICHSNRIMKWMRILKYFTAAKVVAVNHGISFKNSLHCNYIININQDICNMVVATGFNRANSFVLPNVIEVDQKYFQKQLKEPLIIGMYGRIEHRKGFDILFLAAEILQKNNINFRLKIGGFEVDEGNYNWKYLANFAKEKNLDDKYDFVGVVIDKKAFFAGVDIFCVPSREEPFGLVILEGFLHSTLVISSNSEGGKILIKHGEDGFLFKNEDAQDLAQKIIAVKNNQEKYCHFTKNAYSKLEEQFALKALERNFEKILQNIFKK